MILLQFTISKNPNVIAQDFKCGRPGIGAEHIKKNQDTGELEITEHHLSGSNFFCDNTLVTTPVSSYSPNNYGIYNMSGNVAEMVQEEGIACGGGWRSTGYDVRCSSTMNYIESQPDLGFRPILKIEEKKLVGYSGKPVNS